MLDELQEHVESIDMANGKSASHSQTPQDLAEGRFKFIFPD